MTVTYRLSNIKYAIAFEDLDIYEDDFALYSDYVDACQKEIEKIEDALPSTMKATVELDEEDFDEENELNIWDALTDYVSDKTGWLTYGFDYEEVR